MLVDGADMLWFPVGYTAGYLVLLVLVAAPLRRSGAYTLPDFAEARLESREVRRAGVRAGRRHRLALPGAAVAGRRDSPLQRRHRRAAAGSGAAIVALVVVLNVTAGGMRSITFVQAFQYWLKLTAIALPMFFILLRLAPADGDSLLARRGGASGSEPLGGPVGRDHPLYATYSIVLALFFGTMGLPHVLVRFYTNPDGRAARRTTLVVLALLGVFYLFPPMYGALGRRLRARPAGQRRADTVRAAAARGASCRASAGDLLGGADRGRRVRRVPVDVVRAGGRDRRGAATGRARRRLHRRDVAWRLRPALRGFRIAAAAGGAVPYAASLSPDR